MIAQIFRAWQRSPLHPFLFSTYPVLALYITNIQEIDLYVIWRPLLVGLILTGFVFLLFQILTKKPVLSSLLTSLAVILFTSYGHVFDSLRALNGLFLDLVRNRYMVPLWIAFGIFGGLLVFRLNETRKASLHRYLNLISGILILVMLGSAFIYRYEQSSTGQEIRKFTLEIPKINPNPTVQPDIYYIVLDSYPRSDVLKNEYDIDNAEFIHQLEEIGFIVPACSRSNYNYTLSSLSSSLNMEYLDQLPVPLNTKRTNRLPMRELILHSRVRETLTSAGYQSVSIDHKYLFLEWDDADIFYKNTPNILFEPRFRSFERILLRSSILRYLIDAQSDAINLWNRENKLDPQLEKYERLRYAFARIREIPQIQEPTLFFTNIDSIHPPLVFAADGSYTGDSAFEDLTLDQITETVDKKLLPGALENLNHSLLDLVKTLIAESDVPPVIILQGDHALAPSSRNLIFNAYYLQGKSLILPKGMTPVNTFRLILNEYFGAELPLLPDRAYYSDYGKTPYEFSEVFDKYSECQSSE